MHKSWATVAVCSSAVGSGIICVYLGYLSNGAMRESPANAFAHLKTTRKFISLADIHHLQKKGYVVIDNVLSLDELSHAALDAVSLRFQPNDHNDPDVRTDSVIWISEKIDSKHDIFLGEGILHALRCVRSIPQEMTSFGYSAELMGVPLSNQLSFYKGGEFYIAHRDTPEIVSGWMKLHPLRELVNSGQADRKYTIILYLNDAVWDSNAGGLAHSGNLKCFVNALSSDSVGNSASEVVYVEPKGGRMLIFDSKTLLHEVCPSHQNRVALTCWVGGSHSKNVWLRPLCMPSEELTRYVFQRRR